MTVQRLSGRLSPQAKKQALTAPPDRPVTALVELVSGEAADRVRREIEEHGGSAGAWSDETRLLSVRLPAGGLEDLAALDGVVYVDCATRYRR